MKNVGDANWEIRKTPKVLTIRSNSTLLMGNEVYPFIGYVK